MANPIPTVYCEATPNLANSGGDGGQIAVLADDVSGTHYAVFATVGGILTLTITSAGSGLTSGTYNNVAVHANGNTALTLGYLNIGVSSTGIATVVAIQGPGYGFKINDTITLPSGTIGTAGSILTTITVNTVLPCSPPFPPGTKFIEMSSDGAGTNTQGVYVTLDSTLSSLGITNGILTTQQCTLATEATRLSPFERIIRGVNPAAQPFSGLQSNAIAGVAPIQYQVILGTAVF